MGCEPVCFFPAPLKPSKSDAGWKRHCLRARRRDWQEPPRSLEAPLGPAKIQVMQTQAPSPANVMTGRFPRWASPLISPLAR